jgi:hypothetical protein
MGYFRMLELRGNYVELKQMDLCLPKGLVALLAGELCGTYFFTSSFGD